MKPGVLHRDNIRSLRNACGGNPDAMAAKVKQFLESKPDDPKHLDAENFSFKEIAQALGGDVDTHSAGPVFREAVAASQFNVLVGVLVSTKVMDAYKTYTGVVDQLISPFSSNLETDKVPGAYLTGSLSNVGEGAEYPQVADIKDKWVEIGHQKRGLILNITDEAVRFDRTGLVMREAAKLGDRMGRDRESRIMKVIQDTALPYKAWYPSGTQEDLYQHAAGSTSHTYDNLTTDALNDYTDVSALFTLLRSMKDDNGDPIDVLPQILLVPVSLQIKAARVIMNEVLAGGTNNEYNVLKWVLPTTFKILAHPDLDAVKAPVPGTWATSKSSSSRRSSSRPRSSPASTGIPMRTPGARISWRATRSATTPWSGRRTTSSWASPRAKSKPTRSRTRRVLAVLLGRWGGGPQTRRPWFLRGHEKFPIVRAAYGEQNLHLRRRQSPVVHGGQLGYPARQWRHGHHRGGVVLHL